MDTYYSKNGTSIGEAWSTMTCKKVESREKHDPHSYDPEFAMYGPYMCEGFPRVALYLTKDRKPVN